MRLDELKGNRSLKRQLEGPVDLPHACVIAGPEGSGRHTLARLLAQTMVCTQEGLEARPCGLCRSCQKVVEGIHPDVMWVEQFTGSEDKGVEVKIAAARALRQDAYIRPNEARRKVYLIDRPMNVNAQNALLKLLEDGPDYAAFLILTDNPASLLETVRSRCVLFQTAPPEEESELQGESEVRWVQRWVKALCSGAEPPLMECAVELQQEKVPRETLERVYSSLRQLLVEGLTAARRRHPFREQLAALPRDRLIQLIQLAEDGRNQCQRNVSVGHSAGWFAVRSWQILLGEPNHVPTQNQYPMVGGME